MSFNIVEVDNLPFNAAGDSIKVSTPPPEPPPNTIPVDIIYVGTHNNIEYTEYAIPNGKRLIIQRLYCGSEKTSNGTYAEIYDRGLDDTEWNLIGIPLFVFGNNDTIDINISIEASGNPGGSGDEDRYIELLVTNERRAYSAGRIVGYLEDI